MSDGQMLLFGKTLQQQFEEFHRDNPHVYRSLVSLAERARSRGLTHVGIGLLWEVMRWEMVIRTSDPDFKLNNNYRSRYVRLLQQERPDLAGMFRTRHLRKA